MLCAFSNVSSNCLHQRMQSYIGCISFTFLHCGFLNVSSNYQPERRFSHINCICLAFPHYVLSNAQVTGSTGSESRPRFSQLPFWPAGCLTSLVAIENITDIFFPIWTRQEQCTEVMKSVLGRPQGFTEKKYLPRDHKMLNQGCC